MKIALALAALTAAYLGWRGTRAAIRRIREAQFTYHWLTAAELVEGSTARHPAGKQRATDGAA